MLKSQAIRELSHVCKMAVLVPSVLGSKPWAAAPELEITGASWFCSYARIIVLGWFPLCNPVLLSIFCTEGTQCSDLKGKSLKSPRSRKGEEKARCQECQQAVSMTILILTMSIKKTRNPPWRLLLQSGC